MKSVRTETLLFVDCTSHHDDHLLDRLIDLKLIPPWRRFLDVIPYATDNIFCSVGIPYDTAQRIPDFAEIWWAHVQKTRGGTGIVARGGDRMQNLVTQRCGQFSHYAQAIHMREIRLQLAYLLGLLLRAYAFGHLNMRGDILKQLAVRGEQRMASRLEMFPRAIGKDDSVINQVFSL